MASENALMQDFFVLTDWIFNFGGDNLTITD